MLRPVHFEVPADEPDRAVKFYQEAFARESEKWERPSEYWLLATGEEGTASTAASRGGNIPANLS